ncbi:1-deoxy-D-xylulose-5-phosphate reductoisomerase [Aestuariicella hydrocarbonica]|uniref:1-deoxy-D-xylulose 5-phosphate reductoisomerase n=1 Tax=Pseudomaricurvus hydrocarbonicus TaxID=1470433 RepID=A0A9E5MJL8_9GAMM|nr:1-deoxy-D-xylulose-5-phosphate reductoisomerase [Aestuariicella hydrocarbonica]NHO64192.1 1-deoxy-D-xylulose-5-phosphate reductoisomerase [Aestuariicella hydrocarbonica]
MKQNLTILGSTGSIGVSTLDVVARHPERFTVFALTANTQAEALLQQCLLHKPRYAVMRDEAAAEHLARDLRSAGSETQVLAGEAGLVQVAEAAEVQTVMAAIVGSAGLSPTLAAVTAGKKVLLANKESLVMAGGLFMQAVKDSGAVLLPIDSEHNAIFQCLPVDYRGIEDAGIRRILLTGSGGPFRETPIADLASMTPDQACAHPNWSMGRKISVDSATMMNKGLEFVEACWLFDARPEQIEIVVHPQSVIHSMVEYNDGSVLAQMGNPDMRTPIAHALAWPDRIDSGVASLDFMVTSRLDFEAPSFERFPGLRLSIEAAKAEGIMPAVLNAANEVAVAAFLEGRAGFTDIPVIIEKVLGQTRQRDAKDLSVVIEADAQAREMAESLLVPA